MEEKMKNTGFKLTVGVLFLSSLPFSAAFALNGGSGNSLQIRKDIRNLDSLVSRMRQFEKKERQVRKHWKTKLVEKQWAAAPEIRKDNQILNGCRGDAWKDIEFLWGHWPALTRGEKIRVNRDKEYLIFQS